MGDVKICNNKKNCKIESVFLYVSGRKCFDI